jgi:hypothetical protein
MLKLAMTTLLAASAVFASLAAAENTGAQGPAGLPVVAPAHSTQYEHFAATKKDYPEFFAGPTGIVARIENQQGTPGRVVVCGTYEGGPSAGKFEKGDVLQAVNGQSLGAEDPRVPLGVAIGQAEATDGKFVFDVLRGGQATKVAIAIPVLGAYGKDWPGDCEKSKAIIRSAAEFIVSRQPSSGVGLSDCWAGLFLLSTGEDKYLPAVRKIISPLRPETIGNHTWINGYRGVLLGEYYLRTGDRKVLPLLQAICDDAAARQVTGGWNHWGQWNPGYTVGGLMNPAGVQLLTTLILARECGVEVSPVAYNRALKFFFRFAGTGGVAYGDHQPLLYLGDNGKCGMLAAALSLLDGPGFRSAAEVLTMDLMDSYDNIEDGHGGDMFNVMWRGLAGVHTPARFADRYRLHMDKLAWFYDLSRMSDGSFRKLPQPDTSADYLGEGPFWVTGAIGLTYTAPLKTLRITGMGHTKFSVTPPPGAEKEIVFTDFQRSDYVEGGDNAGLTPDELVNKFRGMFTFTGGGRSTRVQLMPASFYAKIMRHYDPIIRTWASLALGTLGDQAAGDYIAEALASKDARLRRSGLVASSCQMNWGYGGSSTAKVNISKELVTSRFLPQILRTIKDPNAPMWEVNAALWALGKADPAAIRENLPAVMPFFDNDEWFQRLGALEAVRPLMKSPDTARLVAPKLLSIIPNEIHIYARREYDELIKKTLADQDLPKDVKDMIVAGRVQAMKKTPLTSGFETPRGLNEKYETTRYLLTSRPDAITRMADDLVALTPQLQDMFVIWLYDGDRWGNPGLIPCVAKLGKDAGPVVAALKKALPMLEKRGQAAKGADRKQYDDIIAGAKKAIADFEGGKK